MNSNRTSLIGALILSFVAPSLAEIPQSGAYEKISRHLKRPIFLEGFAAAKKRATPAEIQASAWLDLQKQAQLDLLKNLIIGDNGPPNICQAFEMAVRNAEVSSANRNGIRIKDKSHQPQINAALETPVKIDAYTGDVNGLLPTIFVPGIVLSLSRSFYSANEWSRQEKENPVLTKFSFSGSLRELLEQLAASAGKNGGYFFTLDDQSRAFVRLFPIDE